MPQTDGERLVKLETEIAGVREDLAAMAHENERTRTRLHNLEGIASTVIETQRANRRSEAEQYRRLELRLQVLTIVLGVAAIVVPALVTILATR